MSHISGLAEADDTRKRILELWANICDAYISVQWTSKLVNRRYFGSLTILPQAMSANVPRSSRFHAAREDRPGSGPLLTPKASDQRKLQIIKVEPRSKPACLIRRIRSHVSESRSLPPFQARRRQAAVSSVVHWWKRVCSGGLLSRDGQGAWLAEPPSDAVNTTRPIPSQLRSNPWAEELHLVSQPGQGSRRAAPARESELTCHSVMAWSAYGGWRKIRIELKLPKY
ncbi:hypothetical protein EDB80DRAFT_676401 [Ilyonectria destructans]|nr:hypothetical protein EDB80DRAFT_676401 [Ilyonectria destructans]